MDQKIPLEGLKWQFQWQGRLERYWLYIVKSAQSKKEKFNLKVIGFMGRGSIKEIFLEVYQNMLFIPPKFPIDCKVVLG